MNRSRLVSIEWDSSKNSKFQIHWGFAQSFLGKALIAESPRGIVQFSFFDPGSDDVSLIALRADWPEADLVRNDERAAQMVEEILKFDGCKSFSLHMKGGHLQQKVSKALLGIPFGETCSYRDLAERMSMPRAVRAIGRALGKNRVSYLIPCHRVIRQDGSLGGYRCEMRQNV